MRRIRATLLAAFFSVLPTACVNHETATPAASEPEVVAAAYRYLKTLRGQYGIEAPREQLQVIRIHTDELGQTHVRFQQVFRGILVYGSEVIAHLDAVLNGRMLTGRLLEIPANATIEPTIDAVRAREAASEASCAQTTRTPELVFYTAQRTPQLAWRVPGSRNLTRCDVFISAEDAGVLGVINRSPTLSAPGQG